MPDNCYSDALYEYREPHNRFWQNSFGLGPETSYQNVALSQFQQLNCYGLSGNPISPTPISYPKVQTPHKTLGSSTTMFQSPSSKVRQSKAFDNLLFPEWPQGHEAMSNYLDFHEQSSNVHSSHQLEESAKNTLKVMGAENCENNREMNAL